MCSLQQLQAGEGGQAPNAPTKHSACFPALLACSVHILSGYRIQAFLSYGVFFLTSTGALLVHGENLQNLPLATVGSHCPCWTYAQEPWSFARLFIPIAQLGTQTSPRKALAALCVKTHNFCFLHGYECSGFEILVVTSAAWQPSYSARMSQLRRYSGHCDNSEQAPK